MVLLGDPGGGGVGEVTRLSIYDRLFYLVHIYT